MEEEEANAYLVVSQVKFCARTLKVSYQFRISESHISRMKTRKCHRALQEGFFSVSYLQDHVFKFVPPKIAVLNVWQYMTQRISQEFTPGPAQRKNVGV